MGTSFSPPTRSRGLTDFPRRGGRASGTSPPNPPPLPESRGGGLGLGHHRKGALAFDHALAVFDVVFEFFGEDSEGGLDGPGGGVA